MSLYGRGYIDALRFVERKLWDPKFDKDEEAPDDREQYKLGWKFGLKMAKQVAGDAVWKFADALEDALKMCDGEA